MLDDYCPGMPAACIVPCLVSLGVRYCNPVQRESLAHLGAALLQQLQQTVDLQSNVAFNTVLSNPRLQHGWRSGNP